MKRTIVVATVAAAFAVFGNNVWAGTTGKIAGKVIAKSNGQALGGANVIIVSTTKSGKEMTLRNIMGAAADMSGEYFINNVPPGRYSVKANYIGYGTVTKQNVQVSVDYTTPLDFALEEEAITLSNVVITADREVIKKDLTSSAAVVNADAIDMMPVTSISEVLDLQAGMIRDTGGQLHIRGGRSTEIAYLVDGVSIVDPLSKTSGLTVDNQAIEELQAITGTFNAEYGQALSGVVNVITKRGTDEFQGTLRSYFSDYLSFDNDLYSIMDDAAWAQAAAEALTRRSKVMFYNGRFYANSFSTRPELKKTGYLNTYDPFNNKDLQANFSGPVPFTQKRLTFFLSGRYTNNDGYQMGKRYFMPWGWHAPLLDTVNKYTEPDNALVPLGWDKNYSIQSKLFMRLSNAISIGYGLYWFDHTYKYGSYDYKYNPEGTKTYYDDGTTHIFTFNHVLSPKTFYEIKASRYDKHHENYLYEDPADYRYIPYQTADVEQYVFNRNAYGDVSLTVNPYDFVFWGNETDRGTNDVRFTSAQLDFTSQITSRHQIKFGAAGTFYDLANDYIALQFDSDFNPIIMPINSPYHSTYRHKPMEISAYLQDKAEFKEIIFNIGIRFDYFDPDGQILADPSDPQIYNPFNPDHIYYDNPANPADTVYTIEQRQAFWFEDVAAKYQISPRFGIAFPITDRGVIHFSYGHFFQNPPFNYLYANPEFEIYGAGTANLIGNADLDAERSVMYEIGLQQALGDRLHFDLTGFYRDIRDWIGTSPAINTYGGRTTYVKYVNKDYGSSKGITLAAEYQTPSLMFNLDYTYMTAEGTTSDPQDAYADLQNDRAPRIQMVALDWDRQHTLNTVLSYRYRSFVASLIGQLYTGFPYTPTFARGEVSGSGQFSGLRENSEKRPTTINFDLRISKEFRFWKSRFEVFMNVYNLFDRRNAANVYSDTGSPEYTLEGLNQESRVVALTDVDEYFSQPSRYTTPRVIQWGVTIGF